MGHYDDAREYDERKKCMPSEKTELVKTVRAHQKTIEENARYVALGKAFELFLTNERIRVLGSACLGETGYQHMGFEIWTKHGYDSARDEITVDTEKNKKQIYKYILGMKGVDHSDRDDEVTLEDLIKEFKDA